MESAALGTRIVASPPVAPETIQDVAHRRTFLEQLLLKILYMSGPLSMTEWGNISCLSPLIVDELFRRLRTEQLCEVVGMIGDVRRVAITTQGRARAGEWMALSQYAGPAPVSLEDYIRQVRLQTVRSLEVHPGEVQRAFAHLVIDDQTLTRLGTALNSGGSIFIYGPTGSGKTTIAEALPRVLADDAVWVPHAVESDGHVITVFDPLVHKKLDRSFPSNTDPRWVYCERPKVVVGGELTIEMLDLQFNPVTKFYAAPGQMKANNGVLIIDDFGRQRVRPEELLNRWVVPLDRRFDFLTLVGGKKIEVPFELFVVFATNMDPSHLADAAFLRRIQTKVHIGMATEQQFAEIFRRVCSAAGLTCDPALVKELISILQNQYQEPLRPCYPRDLINQVIWTARYQQQKPTLDRAALMRAADAYFIASNPGDKASS